MKIGTDARGLFIRTDGRLYRPVKSRDSYEIAHACNSREDGTSTFAAGDDVKARHRSQTPFCVIKVTGGADEYWHSHGEYTGKKSEECWNPEPVRPRITRKP
jgi:hypothetical protein